MEAGKPIYTKPSPTLADGTLKRLSVHCVCMHVSFHGSVINYLCLDDNVGLLTYIIKDFIPIFSLLVKRMTICTQI